MDVEISLDLVGITKDQRSRGRFSRSVVLGQVNCKIIISIASKGVSSIDGGSEIPAPGLSIVFSVDIRLSHLGSIPTLLSSTQNSSIRISNSSNKSVNGVDRASTYSSVSCIFNSCT